MSDVTSSQRIVPDVDQSLTAQHLRHRRGPRLWPLWLVLILLMLLLGAAAVGVWYERERLLAEVHRVSGEVSNLHARLDSDDTEAQDAITFVQAQISTLFQEQEQLAVALTNTREELYGLLTENEELVSNEALETFSQRFEQFQEQAALRDSQLAAIRTSLDALEQAGTSGRQNLVEEVTHLEEVINQRLDTMERQVASDRTATEEQLSIWRENIEQQLTQLSSTVAEVNTQEEPASQAELTALEAQWTQRLNTLESDLRQVRQAQLAFSAQMEMLRN
ncbi:MULTISPECIES: coiled-coil domain-containing protein [Halomonadaceae]|jgi:hypothetical protein|uniref:Uncharacterized protein n=1 Tax=Vreelandella aquamarina TaxID=77097 RepID=A0A0D7UYT0_9GAMM|nr:MULTISPECIES: hypothetical protein [Halomonas]KTG25785.1 hypothetical protein AUR68_20555 [Idiomarina sp. H105]MEC9021772.1 hypothetical protein [Pseudomonadota bacterium]OAE95619.1 hypothetical protein AWR38_20585 [Idiomarina sp. WRN-38]HAV45648.1 hypothetical protein [Halomonas sp.]KJD18632.1 hypothetical protein VE30_12040 [Halomonas meridiana]|tara:strand:+ start:1122 stop:1955 length:834 start_codon:yes stop_codon:yes gene_type:complete